MAAIKQVFGSAQTVINTAVDIAAGNFSGTPAAVFSNTSDALVPLALFAQAMAEFPDWAAAPAAGTVIELWGTLAFTNGSLHDTDGPGGTTSNGARYFGAWVLSQGDWMQRRTINISLKGVNSQINFYLKNATAQNMNNDGGTPCVVKITPFTYG